jgi:hypothetical protein
VRLSVVETTHGDFPWTLLQTFAAGRDAGKYDADVRLVFIPENLVQRAEVSYERSTGHPLGFAHRMSDGEASG